MLLQVVLFDPALTDQVEKGRSSMLFAAALHVAVGAAVLGCVGVALLKTERETVREVKGLLKSRRSSPETEGVQKGAREKTE